MLPLTRGIGVVFHPNPFDARTIGSLVVDARRDVPAGDTDLPAVATSDAATPDSLEA